MSTANREDGFGSHQRGEETSRLETRLDAEPEGGQGEFGSSVMEGLHAEDNPQMMGSIKAAERMGQEDTAAAEGVKKEYLAASADGSVRRMQGDPSYGAIMPHIEDNTWDVLKKKRLAEMKLAAQQKQAWRELGHGTYAIVESDAHFLQELPKHERAVCHLFTPGAIDGEMLHVHMRKLAAAHLETYFCQLDAELAPVMMQMISVAQMPALLLCRGGRVIGQLTGVDRSFTAEGVAFELAQSGMLDFEDGTQYERTAGGCTAATAHRGGGGEGDSSSDEDDRAEGRSPGGVHSDEEDDLSD